MQTKPRYRIGSDGSNARAMPAPPALHGRVSSQYMRGEQSPFFFSWNPSLRDGRDDVSQGYVRAAARAVDALHNSGWLAGGINLAVGLTVGNGLRLASKPDADALGWSKEKADEFAKTVERRFEAWASSPIECDAAGKHTFGQIVRAALASMFTHGEVLALLPHVRRDFSTSRSKVKLMPAHKLRQDNDGTRMFQGVVMDDWGYPAAYRVDMRIGQNYEEPVTIPARDGAGRPQVVHVFDGAPDQVRGISLLAPALRVVRQFDQLSDATLTSTLIQAIFAATIESDAPTADVLNALQDEEEQGTTGSLQGYLTAKAGFYENTKIDLGRAGKIAHLYPGEKLNFKASTSPNDNYEAFAKFLLREIARCLGITFEMLTGDYSGATYSSVRMAISEIWPLVLNRRDCIGRLCQQVFEAWLEEEIATGRIAVPGGVFFFYANRGALTRAEWRGPAKPQADDLKTAKAFEVYKRTGLMSDERIASELGFDWEDEYEQRGREKAKREELDLPETDTLIPPDPVADKLISETA
jgi:lambda family phage portal protein